MNADDPRILEAAARRPWYKLLYVQVLIAIGLGILLGDLAPQVGAAMKPLGDGFIKLVRMLIAPIVFTTVVVGIARMGAMKDVGRIGLRALLYFEIVSTFALDPATMMLMSSARFATLDAWRALFDASNSTCFCRYWHFGGDKNAWLERCYVATGENRGELSEALAARSDEARGVVG